MFEVRDFPSRTLSWWRSRRREIDFDPPFQRAGKVWRQDQKQFLIDSILNRYDMPKLYVVDYTLGHDSLRRGSESYSIVDGKQRLDAILSFFDGEFSLAGDFVFEPNPALDIGGFSYGDLANRYPDIAADFDNFNLPVMSIITNDEARLNSLFVRLNSSSPLTAPELRDARGGVVPSEIRRLVGHPFFASKVRKRNARKEHNEIAAKFLLLEVAGGFVSTKRQQLDALVQLGDPRVASDIAAIDTAGWLGEIDAEGITRSAGRVWKTLDSMSEAFDDGDELLASQGQMPIYYMLFRGTPLDVHARLRDFLVEFETKRQAYRAIIKSDPGAVDPEMARYESLMRNVNDASSMEQRYVIMMGRFVELLHSEITAQSLFGD